MKRVSLLAVCLLAALAARAEWLSWCVSASDDFGDVDVSSVAYMRVGLVKNGEEPMWNGTPQVSYTANGALSTDADGLVGYTGASDLYKVNVSDMGTSYGYYIELLNSSYQVIGRTGKEATFTYETYASLSSSGYISTGSIGDVPKVAVWHGGGFEAVPEPSSLALLALGAGLAGLRRRLRKGKKGTRA